MRFRKLPVGHPDPQGEFGAKKFDHTRLLLFCRKSVCNHISIPSSDNI
jgi:hypothetical protein